MELILQQGLKHQWAAVEAACQALEGVRMSAPAQPYENPRIDLADPRIGENVREIQKRLPPEYQKWTPAGDCLNLDIKMETGTGKTYVYTQTIFELHKRYGFNKFILVVPSLAIKAGAAQFLGDEYVRRHFSDACRYGTEIELECLEPAKNRKKGRTYFPSAVGDFIRGSCQDRRKIHVLLVNMHLLVVKKNGLLSRDDYGYGAEGFYRPLDALRAARPLVMIDEPHRFSRDQKAFQVITDEIHPQCILRYGATFPESVSGRGKDKVVERDYQNLLYDLNACQAFNQGLIKGVAKEHFEPVSKQEEKVKILSIRSREAVVFQQKRRDEPAQTYTLYPGDAMAMVSDAFEGITVQAISQNTVEFSNGVVKTSGEEMDVDIYMSSYQEQMLRLALQRHFETERENFSGRGNKIKTLALFFIDDISSYRPDKEGKAPYLLKAFERLLKERIEQTLSLLNEREGEYRAYLEASLADLSACHAGYFAQDNSDSDEEIARQVDVILHGKKRLLSFRHGDGRYNTLRFLFSKWTLKEGWDNPNVFTIAKLRSSGSENSKLQEVGRGLRLPVDENGNRVSDETFQLNYIVDFTEADFARQLVDQINSELPQATLITEERLDQAAEKLGISADELFDELYEKRFIDRKNNIRPENRAAFLEEYPVFRTGLAPGKVRDRNKEPRGPVKIRKAVYGELREFWELINQRHLLIYDAGLDDEMEDVALALFKQPGVFADVVMTSRRDKVRSDGDRMTAEQGAGVQYTIARPIPYGAFLKRVAQATNLPVPVLHNALRRYAGEQGPIDPRYFNESSASAFCAGFQTWRTQKLMGRFRYVKGGAFHGATALSYPDGAPKAEIAQGRVGDKIAPGTPSEKYLYDAYAYDSPLERANMTADIEEVVAYGKIPRRSVAIPTITGSLYSPDFIFVVRRRSGEKMFVVVETKDVEDATSLRDNEAAKIECARVFFETLSQEGRVVYFKTQLNNRQISQIIDELPGA